MTYDVMTSRKSNKKISIRNPIDIFNFIRRYAKSKQELFLVLTLNTAHEVISVHIGTVGLVNRTMVHPREVYIHAIRDNSTSIVVAHNHPSGSTIPSPEDEDITRKLKDAGKIIGIELIDHLIFNKKEFYSFRESHHILN